jgi:hypothetical protein
MDNATLISEADKDREHRMALQAAADASENTRQKERLLAELEQFDQQLKLYYDQLAQDDAQFAENIDFEKWKAGADLGIEREKLAIDKTTADAQLSLLNLEVAKSKEPTRAGLVYDEIIKSVMQDESQIFLYQDPTTGQMMSRSLAELTNDQLNKVRSTFEARIADYPDLKESLWNIFQAVAGNRTNQSDVIINQRGEEPSKYAEEEEAVSILGDWMTQPAFGTGQEGFPRETGNIEDLENLQPGFAFREVGDWLREPVLGYRKQDVQEKIDQLLKAIPEVSGRGESARRNPDRALLESYRNQLMSEDITTRQIQEIGKALTDLQKKYK